MVATKQKKPNGKMANNRKPKPAVAVNGAILKPNRSQKKNNRMRIRNNNNKNNNNGFKIGNAAKMFQIPPATTSGASGFIDFNEPSLMQNIPVPIPINQKNGRGKKNRFGGNQQQQQRPTTAHQPQQNIKVPPKQNNKNNNSSGRNPRNNLNNIAKKNQRNRNQKNSIHLPHINFPKMGPALPLRPIHRPPLPPQPHLPPRRFGPVGPSIPFGPPMPIAQRPMLRGTSIPPMRPPIRPPAMLRSGPMLRGPMPPPPLSLLPHSRPMSNALIRNGNNQNQKSKNRKRPQTNNNNSNNAKLKKTSSGGSNKKTLKEILNQFPLDKPWVSDAIKAEAKIKENIENRLKGNRNDQLFAEFKIQRDKFVAMYEEAKKEYESLKTKDNKEMIESDKVKTTK